MSTEVMLRVVAHPLTVAATAVGFVIAAVWNLLTN
jgi:hypothetical protein